MPFSSVGSPVFSPSRRLPPSLLSFKAYTPEPSSPFPSSPLRQSSLRAHHHPPAAAPPAAPSPLIVHRRRPPPLIVPVTTQLQLQEEQEEEAKEETGDGFAAYCRKGNKSRTRRRHQMEDRHVATVGLGGDPRAAFFGVFDGHGGTSAAEFAAQNMPRIMAQELQQHSASVEEAVRRAYLRTDDDFCRKAPPPQKQQQGGACCVTALLTQGRLVVSNAGDCRAVLSRAGKAQPLTTDHRASRLDERRRIESQGGLVIDCRGTWRVQGSLAVSRCIGDAHLKPWVLPEPDTTTLAVDDARCEFLVLASDGLWDKVDDQEAVDVARPLCCSSAGASQLSAACRRLVDLAASRGSTDDITVLIVQIDAPPFPTFLSQE